MISAFNLVIVHLIKVRICIQNVIWLFNLSFSFGSENNLLILDTTQHKWRRIAAMAAVFTTFRQIPFWTQVFLDGLDDARTRIRFNIQLVFFDSNSLWKLHATTFQLKDENALINKCPNETWIECMRFLNRDNLQAMQLVSNKFDLMVNKYFGIYPLRRVKR